MLEEVVEMTACSYTMYRRQKQQHQQQQQQQLCQIDEKTSVLHGFCFMLVHPSKIAPLPGVPL